jgi:hypothetical protein
MDGTRFDALIRDLREAITARRVGRRLALGTLLATGVGSLASGDGAAKKKHKGTKTPSCSRRQQRCGTTCIPKKDCCLNPKRGTAIKNGAGYKQCGLCANGVLLTTLACASLDPDGCTECSDRFTCVPVANDTPCRGCGSCQDGLCEDGCESATATCCSDGHCGETCCDNGRACNVTCCGGQSGTAFCCDASRPVCICGGCWQEGSTDCGDGHCCGPDLVCCGTDHCCDPNRGVGEQCVVGCGGNPASATCCLGGQSERCCPDGTPQ